MSFSLPAGTYLLAGTIPTKVKVNNTTVTGGDCALFKNGTKIGEAGQAMYLPAGNDLSFDNHLFVQFDAVAGDTFQVCGYTSATYAADVQSASVLTYGFFDVLKIGI